VYRVHEQWRQSSSCGRDAVINWQTKITTPATRSGVAEVFGTDSANTRCDHSRQPLESRGAMQIEPAAPATARRDQQGCQPRHRARRLEAAPRSLYPMRETWLPGAHGNSGTAFVGGSGGGMGCHRRAGSVEGRRGERPSCRRTIRCASHKAFMAPTNSNPRYRIDKAEVGRVASVGNRLQHFGRPPCHVLPRRGPFHSTDRPIRPITTDEQRSPLPWVHPTGLPAATRPQPWCQHRPRWPSHGAETLQTKLGGSPA
jgi:hypothetical protein